MFQAFGLNGESPKDNVYPPWRDGLPFILRSAFCVLRSPQRTPRGPRTLPYNLRLPANRHPTAEVNTPSLAVIIDVANGLEKCLDVGPSHVPRVPIFPMNQYVPGLKSLLHGRPVPDDFRQTPVIPCGHGFGVPKILIAVQGVVFRHLLTQINIPRAAQEKNRTRNRPLKVDSGKQERYAGLSA